jgi:hypothetical protein
VGSEVGRRGLISWAIQEGKLVVVRNNAEILYTARGRRKSGRTAYHVKDFWTMGQPSSLAVSFFFFSVSSLFYFSFSCIVQI